MRWVRDGAWAAGVDPQMNGRGMGHNLLFLQQTRRGQRNAI